MTCIEIYRPIKLYRRVNLYTNLDVIITTFDPERLLERQRDGSVSNRIYNKGTVGVGWVTTRIIRRCDRSMISIEVCRSTTCNCQHANKCHMSTYESLTTYTLERQTAERLEYVGFYNTSHHDCSLNQHRVIFVERSSTVPMINSFLQCLSEICYTYWRLCKCLLIIFFSQRMQVFGGGSSRPCPLF